MIFLQAHLHEGGVHAGVRREQRGQIGHDADVRDYRVQIFGLHDLAHDVFHLLDVIVGDFDARAGGSFHVDDELAGVGAREKRNADERDEKEAEQENASEKNERFARTVQSFLHVFFVDVQHLFEFGVEAGVESRAPGFLRCSPQRLRCVRGPASGNMRRRAEPP